MTPEAFNKIVQARLKDIQSRLVFKQKHYARGDDRLHNFKRAANFTRQCEEKALLGMLTKQLVSIYDMVDDLENEVSNPIELWDERIGDAIAYLILLEALVKE